jgi:hypothetical protein
MVRSYSNKKVKLMRSNQSVQRYQSLMKEDPKMLKFKTLANGIKPNVRTMNLLARSASVAFSPAQANCLSLGDLNSPQLVYFLFKT